MFILPGVKQTDFMEFSDKISKGFVSWILTYMLLLSIADVMIVKTKMIPNSIGKELSRVIKR